MVKCFDVKQLEAIHDPRKDPLLGAGLSKISGEKPEESRDIREAYPRDHDG